MPTCGEAGFFSGLRRSVDQQEKAGGGDLRALSTCQVKNTTVAKKPQYTHSIFS